MLTIGPIRLPSRCLGGSIAAAFLGSVALAVGAQEGGKLYVGAGLGLADYHGGYEGVSYGDTPLGARLYGGVQLRDRAAVELALASFADVRSGDILGSGVERLRISADYQAIVVRGMFRLALLDLVPRWRKWTVFGTAGGFASEESRHVVELVSSQARDDVTDDSGLAIGAGAIYGFPRVSLRTSVEWFNGGHADHSTVEVAAEFRF
jgi:hypothetical protein